MTILLQDKPVRAADIAVQTMPPDTILLNLNNGYYYSTNPIGAAVWERCDGTRAVADIISEIGRETGRTADEIRGDITGFLDEMIGEGLIRIG